MRHRRLSLTLPSLRNGLLAAVVLGEASIVALSAPFALALFIGILVPVAPLPDVRLDVDQPQVLKGGQGIISVKFLTPVDVAALRGRP